MNVEKKTKVVITLEPEEATDLFNVIHGVLDDHDVHHGAQVTLSAFVEDLEPYL